MKSNKLLVLVLLIFFFVLFAGTGTYLYFNSDSKAKMSYAEKKASERYRFVKERMQFEYDMEKNPTTGKIPDGVKEQEIIFAKNAPRKSNVKGRMMAYDFSSRGPGNLGGRTRAIAFDISDATNNTILAGGVSGGVFRTVNGGASWTKVSPSNQMHNVTSIAQDTRAGNQHIWYYSTGEASGNSASLGASYLGMGVWKSTDNGLTWTRLASSNTGSQEAFDNCNDYISKIIVNPVNGNVYIAALARIQRSIDGGTTWNTVLGPACTSSANMTDIVCTSAGVFYAAFTGQLVNTADGVWTSATGASGSWTRIAGNGTPAGWNTGGGGYGRVVLALAPSNQNILYALYDNFVNSDCAGVAAPEADLFQYTANTTTWVNLSANLPDEAGCSDGNDPFGCQGGYDLCVTVKPDDPNTVFIGGTNVYRSTNGFTSTAATTRIGGYASTAGYTKYSNHHPDIHTLVFQPGSNSIMWTGTDGGIHKGDVTVATVVWTNMSNNYTTYQYYHVAIHPESGRDDVLGGAQDNGTTTSTSGTTHTEIYTGDGCAVGMGTGATYVQYVSTQSGNIRRRLSNLAPGFSNANIRPTGTSSSLFVTYFYLDTENSEAIYYADADNLYRNLSASAATTLNWTEMTGVGTTLTNNIRSMAATRTSYSASSKLFIGTQNGRIYRLDDPRNAAVATAPVDITPAGASTAAGTIVSAIAVNPRNDDTIIAVYSNYGINSIYWTGNASSATPTWQLAEGNLNLPSIRSAAITLTNTGIEYFVGTTVGLYSTKVINAGSTVWVQEGSATIQYAIVSSLAYRPSDNRLLVGTHGNGMFMADLGTALPLDIVSFSGSRNESEVSLIWKTANEMNTHKIEIERSGNGLGFKKVGELAAMGFSYEGKEYHFTDGQVPDHENYYRLKIIDKDNSFRYSAVISVAKHSEEMDVIIYPIPFEEGLTINFKSDYSSGLKFSLIDVSGKKMALSSKASVNGKNIEINFSSLNLKSGVYYLEIVSDKGTTVKRIVKK